MAWTGDHAQGFDSHGAAYHEATLCVSFCTAINLPHANYVPVLWIKLVFQSFDD